jgi:hypothetical protein
MRKAVGMNYFPAAQNRQIQERIYRKNWKIVYLLPSSQIIRNEEMEIKKLGYWMNRIGYTCMIVAGFLIVFVIFTQLVIWFI